MIPQNGTGDRAQQPPAAAAISHDEKRPVVHHARSQRETGEGQFVARLNKMPLSSRLAARVSPNLWPLFATSGRSKCGPTRRIARSALVGMFFCARYLGNILGLQESILDAD